MDAKRGYYDVKLKGRMDKGRYYDVEMQGWLQQGAIWCAN